MEPLEQRVHLSAGLLSTATQDVSVRTQSLTKGVNAGRLFWLPQTDYARDIWRSTWTPTQWKTYADQYFPAAEQKKLKQSGFDHVRVPVDLSEIYSPNLSNPSAGELNRAFLAEAFDPKVREILSNGLSVVIVPFRKNGEDAEMFIDGLVFDLTWRTVLADFWKDFTTYAMQNRRGIGGSEAYDPSRVVFQLINEPRLTEIWRNGQLVDAGTNNARWCVVDPITNEEVLSIQEHLHDGGHADNVHVRASAFAPLQTELAIAQRAADPQRLFTLMTGTPIYNEVTFDADLIRTIAGERFETLAANRQVTTGDFFEGTLTSFRDYNTTRALTDDHAASQTQRVRTSMLPMRWNDPAGFDTNVIYNFHYYTNGIFATNSGDFESFTWRMIYPMPLDVNASNLDAKRSALLAAIRGRIGLDADGRSLSDDESTYVGLVSANRKWIIEWGGEVGGTDASKVERYYLNTLRTAVDAVLGYLAFDQSPAALQADIDRVKDWSRTNKRVFVIADEIGVRQHEWHTFSGTDWYYVRPFESAPQERLGWYERVRKHLDGTLGEATTLGWTAWDYAGDLGITEPKLTAGTVPTVTFSSDWIVSDDNVDGYARALSAPMARALGVKPFDYVFRRSELLPRVSESLLLRERRSIRVVDDVLAQ